MKHGYDIYKTSLRSFKLRIRFGCCLCLRQMLETDVGIHWDVNGTLNNLSADPVAEWLRTLIFSALNRLSSHRCGYEPSSFCLPMAMWFFSGISHFRPNSQLTRLKMSEIMLTSCKPQLKNTKQSFRISQLSNVENSSVCSV